MSIIKKAFIYVLVIALVYASVPPMEPIAWGGTTHNELIGWGFDILERDLGTTITGNSNYQTLKSYYSVIYNAADDPDAATDDVLMEVLGQNSVWASHFYNPNTGQTYTSSNSASPNSTPQIHALYQLKKYMSKAVTEWKLGRHEAAAYYLGYASHFMADANNPHHAALKTVFDDTKNHGSFEDYVNTNKNKFRIYTVGTNPLAIYQNTVTGYVDFNDFLTKTLDSYGKTAYNYYFSDAYITNGEGARWDAAAYPTMAGSQKCLALLIYRFIEEVGRADKGLQIRVSTADELYAGTDDDVFFGMETSDGKTKEFLLDNLTYSAQDIQQVNDFEQNTTGTYYQYFYDPNFDLSKVTRVWMRKDPLVTTAGDDWKLGRVDILVNGQWVHCNTLNALLDGTTKTYYWNTPGGLIQPTGSAIGNFSVTIKTADVSFAGTDNDVYFGMILKNGMKIEYKCDLDSINDHEQGDKRTYSFSMWDAHYQPDQINYFYFRKYTDILEGGIEDEWKVEAMSVKMYGRTVYAKNLNTWLQDNNNQTYSWYVGGFSSANNLLGFVDATIATSSDLFSGTDDDVYYGLQFSDGTYMEFLCDKNAYNDFEAGSTDTYSFCFPKTRSTVNAIYVRKKALSSTSGDDWKVYTIVSKIEGATVNSKTASYWLKGGSDLKYSWTVSGL